jgi:hypothetical protein
MPGAWYDHGHTKFDLNLVKITKLCLVKVRVKKSWGLDGDTCQRQGKGSAKPRAGG